MDSHIRETKLEDRLIYLDELSWHSVFGLLFAPDIRRTIVLNEIHYRHRFWKWLLNKKGIQIVEAGFFAGHLKTDNNESVFQAARNMAMQISFKAATSIVQSDKSLQQLNDKYKRNTILLFVAKQLHLPIEYWTNRVLVAKALTESCDAVVWLKKPLIFDQLHLIEVFPDTKLHFYSNVGFSLFEFIKKWRLHHIARYIPETISSIVEHKVFFESDVQMKPSVLTLQEDTIRSDRSLRGQPHWLDIEDPVETFDTFVVALGGDSKLFSEDISKLSNTGVKILPLKVLKLATRSMRNNKTLLEVSQDKRFAISAALRARGYAQQYFLMQVAFLLSQAQSIGALALCLNTKVFLNRETYRSLGDAMQLVANGLNITTVSYQYSNLGIVGPLMMSTSDKCLIFSEMYKAIFQAYDVKPQTFLVTGYLYDGVANEVREKAIKHRESFNRSGARFILCYFDESVQHGRWGLVDTNDHLAELHSLSKALLADSELGILVKSQFAHNSPSKLYPNDELLQAAKSTGRYLELTEGAPRNDIYPTEAALVSDICIGHKFGATASLEAAIAGVRSVLLDPYETKTLWDSVYEQANIEFKSLESLLAAIALYRSGSVDHQDIGDWNSILHHFDPYRDGHAASRLRNVIEQIVVD
jgi:hypothetical protein